jgi:hypothetical protein
MIDSPVWSTFDASAPPPLPDHSARPGRLVAVVATSEAPSGGWALATTVDLVKSWGDEGHKVVLADLALDSPELHRQLGTENTEGVVDTVLFGTSVRRVARPAEEGAYFFITAGTIAADSAAIIASDRWARICDGFVEAGVTLVAYVDGASIGSDAALALATDIVVLGSASEPIEDIVGRATAPIVLFTGPGAEVGSDALAPDDEDALFDPLLHASSDAAEDDSVVSSVDEREADPPPPELTGVDASVLGADQHAGVAMSGDDAEVTPAKGGSRDAVLLALSVVILAIIAAGSLGLVEIPLLFPDSAPPTVQPISEPVSRSVPVPVPEAMLSLGYSVTVGAYQDVSAAEDRAQLFAETEGVFAAIAPVAIDDAVFYRVLIGPATDSTNAMELAARLATETGADPSGWVVRQTPLAFMLGEIAELDAASRRVEALAELDVPAYVLAVDYSDGTTRHRVYAGAYQDENESVYFQRHLETQGVSNASLSLRIGRIP